MRYFCRLIQIFTVSETKVVFFTRQRISKISNVDKLQNTGKNPTKSTSKRIGEANKNKKIYVELSFLSDLSYNASKISELTHPQMI